MRKRITALLAAALLAILLPGCNSRNSENAAGNAAYVQALEQAYYLDAEAPAYTYLQNHSIQRFFAMWLNEYMGRETQAEWHYSTLAPVQLLDHSFTPLADTGTELYTCTYTTAGGETGYIIVSYHAEGPAIEKWSLHASPYQYDLRANMEAIAAALEASDIDLPTATAARVEWIDTDKNRGDRIILFEDGKGDRYVCYLGDEDFSLEKQ